MLGNLGLRPKEAINYVIFGMHHFNPLDLLTQKKKKKWADCIFLRQRNVLERILEQESKV